MEQVDQQPEHSGAMNLQAAEKLLSSMTESIEGIETLRYSLVTHLSQDVERLQKQKAQLIEEIERLQTQRQQLVSQIGPELANQLQELLTQRLNQFTNLEGATSVDNTPDNRLDTLNPLIATFDATLRTTFSSLLQDLSSYQRSVSEQLHQMYSLERQGEVILETLVNRLKAEIPPEFSATHSPPASTYDPLPPPETEEYSENSNSTAIIAYSRDRTLPAVPPVSEPEPLATVPQPPPVRKPLIGLLLVLLSLLALGFENVVITILFNSSPIPGLSEPIGGLMVPTVGNVLLILWLRMLVVVPLMGIFAHRFYPTVWRDIQQFLKSQDWGLFGNLVSSGFFLFLSKVLIYLALASIAPGVAVTIFFIYPIVLLLLGDRFSRLSSLVIFSSVIAGFVLATLPTGGGVELSRFGVTTAAGSGIAFAIHLILMQMSAKKLHPIPILWLNLAVVLTFSALGLVVPWQASWSFEVESTLWPRVIISGLALGGVTLFSYLFNYMGIARIGAASASILGAILPALTALLALILIQSTLQIPQILGMILVTLGVAALGFDRSALALANSKDERSRPKTPNVPTASLSLSRSVSTKRSSRL